LIEMRVSLTSATLAWNHNPPDHHLPSNWKFRYEPQFLASVLQTLTRIITISELALRYTYLWKRTNG
jgi:hypothetical protein